MGVLSERELHYEVARGGGCHFDFGGNCHLARTAVVGGGGGIVHISLSKCALRTCKHVLILDIQA